MTRKWHLCTQPMMGLLSFSGDFSDVSNESSGNSVSFARDIDGIGYILKSDKNVS